MPIPFLIPTAHAFAHATFTPGAAATVPLPQLSLPFLLAAIINFVLLLVAVIALAFLVYGGFKYMSAQGDEKELEAAKRTIAGAVIGIVVVGLAYAIVAFTVSAVLTGQ